MKTTTSSEPSSHTKAKCTGNLVVSTCYLVYKHITLIELVIEYTNVCVMKGMCIGNLVICIKHCVRCSEIVLFPTF